MDIIEFTTRVKRYYRNAALKWMVQHRKLLSKIQEDQPGTTVYAPRIKISILKLEAYGRTKEQQQEIERRAFKIPATETNRSSASVEDVLQEISMRNYIKQTTKREWKYVLETHTTECKMECPEENNPEFHTMRKEFLMSHACHVQLRSMYLDTSPRPVILEDLNVPTFPTPRKRGPYLHEKRIIKATPVQTHIKEVDMMKRKRSQSPRKEIERLRDCSSPQSNPRHATYCHPDRCLIRTLAIEEVLQQRPDPLRCSHWPNYNAMECCRSLLTHQRELSLIQKRESLFPEVDFRIHHRLLLMEKEEKVERDNLLPQNLWLMAKYKKEILRQRKGKQHPYPQSCLSVSSPVVYISFKPSQ
jgi:hypothetical protein